GSRNRVLTVERGHHHLQIEAFSPHAHVVVKQHERDHHERRRESLGHALCNVAQQTQSRRQKVVVGTHPDPADPAAGQHERRLDRKRQRRTDDGGQESDGEDAASLSFSQQAAALERRITADIFEQENRNGKGVPQWHKKDNRNQDNADEKQQYSQQVNQPKVNQEHDRSH